MPGGCLSGGIGRCLMLSCLVTVRVTATCTGWLMAGLLLADEIQVGRDFKEAVEDGGLKEMVERRSFEGWVSGWLPLPQENRKVLDQRLAD
ncbi:hypothetical protein PGT21_027547 [Puccinia graminis f. sp. tritici]|uniref:Uncharacterized protein n=1 Tax=Puccinia graminis f. sp. tritici TaxID=56615 RepID=A0A5B0QJ10_PUCGR|nr:hypothetical protein PGT21_027547 [Puccinia graminis f. sp. tritici]